MAKIIRKKKHVIIIVIIVMISTVHLYLKRLQIHETIVSLKDSSLEEYMPTIATSSYNTRTALPDRLATAVAMAARMFQTGAYMQLVCPDKQKLGFRPSDHIASKIGTTCEPWQNREMIGVLDHVLDPSMVALEWSTGSGTTWMVRKGITLHSIEHCDEWLKDIAKVMPLIDIIESDKEGTAKKWTPHHVARGDGQGCSQNLSADWATMDNIFGDYARYARQKLYSKAIEQRGGFDFVSVDGRFRDGCLAEATSLPPMVPNYQPMLINPQYGMVLLDNAERTEFRKPKELPSHWLVVSFQNGVTETALWMACPNKEDTACTEARKRIVSIMAKLPSNLVGSRYKAHMKQALVDKVPGALG